MSKEKGRSSIQKCCLPNLIHSLSVSCVVLISKVQKSSVVTPMIDGHEKYRNKYW